MKEIFFSAFPRIYRVIQSCLAAMAGKLKAEIPCKNKNSLKQYPSDKYFFCLLAIFLLFFLLLEPLGRFNHWVPSQLHTGFYSITQIDPADDSSWYAYLRSMVIDGDIDFFNEKGYRSRYMLTSTGYSLNWLYSFGTAILWLPYFLIGHGIAWIYQTAGYPFPADGFSPPYHVLTGIGSATNALIGMFLLYLILKRYFSRTASFLAVNIICYSSFFPFYIFIRSRLAHANEFLCIVIFLYLWLIIYEDNKREKAYYLLLGISAGLLAAVRLNDLPFIAIFLFSWGREFFLDLRAGRKNLGQNITHFFLFFAPLLIIISPLFIISKILFNNFFSLENAKITSDSATALGSSISAITRWFSHFRLIPLLFSADKGLIFSSPALAAGFAGFFLFIKKHRYVGYMFFTGFLINIFQVVTFFSFGVEYGTRYLTPSLPFFALGLAALINRFRSNAGIVISTGAGILLIVWQYIQLVQYKVFMRWDDPDFIFKSFKNIPNLINEKSFYLLRSTSWFNLIKQKSFQLVNYVDYFFMVITPLLQLFIPLSVLILSILLFKNSAFRHFFVDRGMKIVVGSLLLFFISLPFILIACNPPKEKSELYERHKFLATMSLNRQQYKSAREHFEKSFQFLDGRDIAAEKVYGSILTRLGEYKKAAEILENVLKQDVKDTSTRLELSYIYPNIGEYGKSVSHLEAILSYDPSSWAAYRNLGHLYAVAFKDSTRAKDYFNKAIKLKPPQGIVEEIKGILAKLQ